MGDGEEWSRKMQCVRIYSIRYVEVPSDEVYFFLLVLVQQ